MIWTETGENVLFSDGSCGQMENCGEEEQKLSEEQELFKKNRKQSMVSADQELIRGILEICSRHSLYAYEREISQGFLTIRGGHRIGSRKSSGGVRTCKNSPGYLILKHPHRPRDKRMREIRAAASSVRGRVS